MPLMHLGPSSGGCNWSFFSVTLPAQQQKAGAHHLRLAGGLIVEAPARQRPVHVALVAEFRQQPRLLHTAGAALTSTERAARRLHVAQEVGSLRICGARAPHYGHGHLQHADERRGCLKDKQEL